MLHASKVNLDQRTSAVVTRTPAPEGFQASAERRERLYATGLETIFVANFHDVLQGQTWVTSLRISGQPTEKKMLSLGFRHLFQLRLGDGGEIVLASFDLTFKNAYRIIEESAQPVPQFS